MSVTENLRASKALFIEAPGRGSEFDSGTGCRCSNGAIGRVVGIPDDQLFWTSTAAYSALPEVQALADAIKETHPYSSGIDPWSVVAFFNDEQAKAAWGGGRGVVPYTGPAPRSILDAFDRAIATEEAKEARA